MKKQKKQKLLNIWNKVKKPLMILSFVGNIIFLLFIIVGCVGVKKKTTQAKAENELTFTLRDTSWDFEDVPSETPGGQSMTNLVVSSETYILGYGFNGLDKAYGSIVFGSSNYLNTYGGYYFNELGGQTFEIFAYFNTRNLEYHWNDERFKHIYIPNEQANNTAAEDTTLIEWFQTFANPTYTITNFEFISQINYNGYFGQPLDSMFINASNTGSKEVNIDLPFFISNGQVFNRITLWYLNGGSMAYLTDEGSTAINENNHTWYFSLMYYENTLTGLSVAVNYRKFNVGSSTYLVKGSTWKGLSYRYLSFQGELTPEQRTNLESFNNDYFSGFSGVGGEVGLGNVFSLLSSGFGAFINVMKIEILPGLSLGLLCFLPLVLIVIMVIIKLVKR